MKKVLKTSLCLATGVCVLTGAGLSAFAANSSLPSAGASASLDSYITSTSSSSLPGAGVFTTLNNYYAQNPDASADAQIIDNKVTNVASEYADIAIAQVNDYVNVRSASNEEAEILGKLYNNSAATILGEEGDWYQIKSGSVTGYVKKEYVVSGDEAATLAEQVGNKIATVVTDTLKVRENAGTDSSVVTLVPADEELNVLETTDNGWTKVSVDSDVVGYVSNDYITVRTKFVEAESIEEEKARIAEEEAAKQAAEEAARKADEAAKKAAAAEEAAKKAAKEEAAAKKAAAKQAAAEAEAAKKAAKEEAAKQAEESAKQTESTETTTDSSSESTSYSAPTSGSRQAIVSYALQFVGNPYVAGGTSLTKGADCSGFVQSVFRDCGYSLPRSSREQAAAGREVSLDELQPGDLLFYSKGGSINHVALYIGNGQVVHASTERTGIKISNYNYRTPCKAVSFVD